MRPLTLGHILWKPRLAELLHWTRFGEINEYKSGLVGDDLVAEGSNDTAPSRTGLGGFDSIHVLGVRS